MIWRSLLGISFCFLTAVVEAKGPTQDLSQGWRFSPGDQPEWAAEDFDDSGWDQIEVGKPWERAGNPRLDGYAWYRLRFKIDPQLRDSPELQRSGKMIFCLGKIDDIDQAWLNGTSIGQTGSFPDSYSTQWAKQRLYEGPSHLLRSEQENVLAVRVYDGSHLGGMYEGPY